MARGRPSISHLLAWHKMAENSSNNLLNTRSHVLPLSAPAKRYPLMGTKHITQIWRFHSKTPKNVIFAPENVFFSGFFSGSTAFLLPVRRNTTKIWENSALSFFVRVETGLALISRGPNLLETARESLPRRSLCGRQKTSSYVTTSAGA